MTDLRLKPGAKDKLHIDAESKAEYMRAWRKLRPKQYDRERAAGRARGRARQRVIDAHREEYDRYYAEERRREGLAP